MSDHKNADLTLEKYFFILPSQVFDFISPCFVQFVDVQTDVRVLNRVEYSLTVFQFVYRCGTQTGLRTPIRIVSTSLSVKGFRPAVVVSELEKQTDQFHDTFWTGGWIRTGGDVVRKQNAGLDGGWTRATRPLVLGSDQIFVFCGIF